MRFWIPILRYEHLMVGPLEHLAAVLLFQQEVAPIWPVYYPEKILVLLSFKGEKSENIAIVEFELFNRL